MGMNENGADTFGPARSQRAKGIALNPLHEAAMRLAGLGMNGLGIGSRGINGFGINKSREKTKDLVTMLLSHGARAWRHSQPEAKIHLHVTSRAGRSPIRMKLR